MPSSLFDPTLHFLSVRNRIWWDFASMPSDIAVLAGRHNVVRMVCSAFTTGYQMFCSAAQARRVPNFVCPHQDAAVKAVAALAAEGELSGVDKFFRHEDSCDGKSPHRDSLKAGAGAECQIRWCCRLPNSGSGLPT
jgi:hypothetical protein